MGTSFGNQRKAEKQCVLYQKLKSVVWRFVQKMRKLTDGGVSLTSKSTRGTKGPGGSSSLISPSDKKDQGK